MRNKYPGICYRCGAMVEIGKGHFEKYGSGRKWRTQHAECAIKFRKPREYRLKPPSKQKEATQ